jgi:hypothetical protein
MDYVDFLKFFPFLINTNSYLLRRMNTKLKKKDLVLRLGSIQIIKSTGIVDFIRLNQNIIFFFFKRSFNN